MEVILPDLSAQVSWNEPGIFTSYQGNLVTVMGQECPQNDGKESETRSARKPKPSGLYRSALSL
jgi:hypothetical protein